MLHFKRKDTPDNRLVLRNADEQPLYAFPPEVIQIARRMITGLTFQEKMPKRLSLVSALREEGVTYTTLALATTLANDMAVNVCAVELNWFSPGMQSRLCQPTDPAPKRFWQRKKKDVEEETPVPPINSLGLAGVLQEIVTLEEALVATHLPNLKLLPAGSMPVEQVPIVARSMQLKVTIETLSDMFDYVLLDIPAILSTSDSIALASLGSACCIVVQQGTTTGTNVRTALDDIAHLPMLGVIINRFRLHTPRWIYNLVPQE